MKKLELFYPVRPHIVNQKWGVYDELYKQFGFSRHNGVDLNLVNGQPICAPFDCTVVKIGEQPKGGGIYIGILSQNIYDFDDGISCYVLVDFLHCKELIKKSGDKVNVGEVIALGDNTGVSTGPHTHMQLRRVNYKDRVLTDIDKNEANNSFDPEPYWNKIYADTFPKVLALKRAVEQLSVAIKNLFAKRSDGIMK